MLDLVRVRVRTCAGRHSAQRMNRVRVRTRRGVRVRGGIHLCARAGAGARVGGRAHTWVCGCARAKRVPKKSASGPFRSKSLIFLNPCLGAKKGLRSSWGKLGGKNI